MILVDTSIWIEFFRKDKPTNLETTIDFDDIVTCLPVIQEVLQGFNDQPAFQIAERSMFAFPIVEFAMTMDVYKEAIALYRLARRSGFTVRSSVDCLIAACAIRNSLTVLHCDRDFTFLSKISALDAQHLNLTH